MKRCTNCQTWHNNEETYCDLCFTELERNEVSSEDGDDGDFAPDIYEESLAKEHGGM